MPPSNLLHFDFWIPPRSATQPLSLQKPLVRLILLSIALCTTLWFIYTMGYDPIAPYHRHRHEVPNHYRPLPSSSFASPSLWSARADQVREAYLHAYRGYSTYAGEHDELLPITNGHINK
jgi:hypothetical protein